MHGNIYEHKIHQNSNVDNHNLHNRKATPQFAVIDCAFILLWHSFPEATHDWYDFWVADAT